MMESQYWLGVLNTDDAKSAIDLFVSMVNIGFHRGETMDKVEAKRNIEKYETEITKWQALSRGLMSRDEMMLVDKKIAQLKERSKNLRNMLHA